MKPTLLLFGKSLCHVCELASDILAKLEPEYKVLRIDMLSFFSKESLALEILGMRMYTLATAMMEHFGQEYVLLLKYNPETQECGYVPFKPYVVVGKIDAERIDFEALRSDIDSAPYNEWPPSKK
ncbi:glutaredoxin-2 protein [Squirrelpox virus]|uniref:Glutaredoxin-2 n=1 Tax=Squirrelpox virus TaxID=240426 RepID=U3UBI7_9POXV|nr:glutaredoxin-2 protein [Squirrelpox virus]CCD83230.1 glutaredoxin-2 protein [Squirrelpox virus]